MVLLELVLGNNNSLKWQWVFSLLDTPFFIHLSSTRLMPDLLNSDTADVL